MTEHLVTIHLHGPLAEQYGETHRLAVRTPVEAVRALNANYPGFIAAFAKHERYGLYADGDWRGDEQAAYPFGKELHICPIIEGRAFIGAALVTAVFPAIGATAATIIGGVLMAGVLFGLSYLLTPKVKRSEEEGRDQNYAFTGPENVTGQGVSVPLIYGRVHAGSVVVSAGLDLGTDLAATVPEAAPPPPAVPSTGVEAGLAPPPGGWPPIIMDRYGRRHPQGWVLVKTVRTISGMVISGGAAASSKYAKTVHIWQAPNVWFIGGTPPTRRYWQWNEVRGFYSVSQGTFPGNNEYEPGGHR